MVFFWDFHYGFQIFVSDGISSVFNRCGTTRAIALDIFKAIGKVYGISGWIFGLILSFFSNGWLWVDGKSLHSYPVNAGVPQGSILGLAVDDICNIVVYTDDSTLCVVIVICPDSNSFFSQTARMGNSLLRESFPLTYYLSGFKSRVNRYLLSLGCF